MSLKVEHPAGFYRSVELATPHQNASRRRQEPRLYGVRQDFRDQFRPEAAHPHPQQRKALSVRGLFQGVHAVL